MSRCVTVTASPRPWRGTRTDSKLRLQNFKLRTTSLSPAVSSLRREFARRDHVTPALARRWERPGEASLAWRAAEPTDHGRQRARNACGADGEEHVRAAGDLEPSVRAVVWLRHSAARAAEDVHGPRARQGCCRPGAARARPLRHLLIHRRAPTPVQLRLRARARLWHHAPLQHGRLPRCAPRTRARPRVRGGEGRGRGRDREVPSIHGAQPPPPRAAGRAGPGPAAYAVRASAVGSQLVSTKVSSAAYGFGSATREHTSRVFISRTHARTASVRPDGPGPANAHAFVGAIGRPESCLLYTSPSPRD